MKSHRDKVKQAFPGASGEEEMGLHCLIMIELLSAMVELLSAMKKTFWKQ